MEYYPVFLDLRGRRCAVVGGNAAAAEKVEGLLRAGARVTVVAPRLTAGLAARAAAGEIRHHARRYRPGDLAGCFLAVCVLADPAVAEPFWAEAEQRGVVANVMDAPQRCSFIAPSVVRRGDLAVAVSTAGKAPALAVRLRQWLERHLGEEHARFLELAGAAREAVKRRWPDFAERRRRWYELVDSDVLALLAGGEEAAARRRLAEILGLPAPAGGNSQFSILNSQLAGREGGVVYLVGAGPGAPDLVTVRGLACLRRAEVVVYDRLVDRRLLDEAPPEAELLDAGKAPGRRGPSQQTIDALLVERARAGRVVVRLKGGDPFVFGRGGEEMAACTAAGVACEVVPGVTSAVGVPAAAGIPLTRRGVAASFAVVTAHRAADLDDLDWPALARLDTLVVLMGVARLPYVAANLVRAGRSPRTPAALVEWGTWPQERLLVAPLAELPGRAAAAGIGSPAVIVVGEVVALRGGGAAAVRLETAVASA